MELTPDQTILWQWGWLTLNATLVWTLFVDAVLVVTAWLIVRRFVTPMKPTRGQHVLETLLLTVREQLGEITGGSAERYLPFLTTLFLYIAVSNILGILPIYTPPTASLSTTTALALSVFVAVPVFGIASQGVGGYLKHYVEPSVFMLPFNVLGELSRTVALAVRLFGNIMSGTLIVGILVAIAPLIFPVVMQVLGLLTGFIQAYIFAVLAAVYIASATRAHERVVAKARVASSEEQS